MKKVFSLAILLLFMHSCFAAFPAKPAPDSAQKAVVPQQQATRQPLQSLSVKDYEHQIGRKLTLKEKLSFVLMQTRLKKADGTKGTVGSAVGGFFLGLLLAPVGVLIAYLLPKNKTLRTWTWIGFGIIALLLLFIFSIGGVFDWH